MILILGGTGEARALAAQLVDRGVPVVSSLAGRVAHPRLPAGEVRIGGFGGPTALAAWLTARRTTAVIDATHPFAQRISTSAARACAAAGVPRLLLQRPGWQPQTGDRWHRVPDLTAAAAAVDGHGDRVLLTTGRQGLESFAGLSRPWFLIRCVDPPTVALPPRHALLLTRGPYTPTGEGELIDRHRIDLVVTKDSGGELTRAKLDAARVRGLGVIVVQRPPRPAGDGVTDVAAACDWALAHASAPMVRRSR